MKRILTLIVACCTLTFVQAQDEFVPETGTQVFGLMYNDFDVENYGISSRAYRYKKLGYIVDVRSHFGDKPIGTMVNFDLLLNYSYDFYQKEHLCVFGAVSFGPSWGMRDVIKGFDKYGNIKTKSKSFIDAYGDITVNVQFYHFMVYAGYSLWAPKFKFSTNKGLQDGFMIGVGYACEL